MVSARRGWPTAVLNVKLVSAWYTRSMTAGLHVHAALEAADTRLQTVVGYDERWVSGGVGRFAQEIVGRLRSSGLQMVRLGLEARIASPISPFAISTSISRCKADIFWSPGFMPPLRSHVPSVVTIHDLIHRRYGGVARRWYYDAVIRPLARRLSAILTVSEHSRADIVRWLGPNHPPIHVVGNGVGSAFVTEGVALRLRAPYALYSGNHRSHKNLARMIAAFSRATSCSRLLLAMTGDRDDAVDALARRYGVSDRLYWLGAINDEQLAQAYRGATLLLMVSLAEGFGLPVIEAMACGTPVVCSSTTSLVEISGDAACLVDPTDVNSISTGIERVITDSALQRALSERGLARASAFSWNDVATRVLAVLEEAAGK